MLYAAPSAVGSGWPGRWAVLGLYTLLVVAGVLHHEPWRDETHAWMIVLNSDSLPALVANTRYEGHPMGWFWVLYAVKLLGGSFLVVQMLHGALGVLTAYIVLTCAPFPIGVRVALVFGYFLGYEYVLIARDYAIGVLLVVGLCVAFARRHDRWGHLLVCGLVGLVCQTNVFALLIGFSIYGVVLLEALLYRTRTLRTHWPRYVAGLGVVVVAGLVALHSFLTPPDLLYTFYTHGDRNVANAVHVFNVFWSAYVPLPSGFRHFWNSNLLLRIADFKLREIIQAVLAVGLVAGLVLPLFRSRLALLGWAGACGLMLYLLFAHYYGSMRHHGHLFVSLIAFLWVQPLLADYQFDKTVVPGILGPAGLARGWAVVLALELMAAGVAYAADWQHPFSMNQTVAASVQAGPLRHWFRAGDIDYAVEGIAAYLPDHRMYYPNSGQHNEFIRFNTKRHLITVRRAVDSVRRAHRGPALLILNRPAEPRTRQALGLSLVRSFTGSIVADEQYWLYALDTAATHPR